MDGKGRYEYALSMSPGVTVEGGEDVGVPVYLLLGLFEGDGVNVGMCYLSPPVFSGATVH